MRFVVEVHEPVPEDREELGRKLAHAFRLDEEKVAVFLRRIPGVVTKPVTEQQANVIARLLQGAGLSVVKRMEPEEAPASGAPSAAAGIPGPMAAAEAAPAPEADAAPSAAPTETRGREGVAGAPARAGAERAAPVATAVDVGERVGQIGGAPVPGDDEAFPEQEDLGEDLEDEGQRAGEPEITAEDFTEARFPQVFEEEDVSAADDWEIEFARSEEPQLAEPEIELEDEEEPLRAEVPVPDPAGSALAEEPDGEAMPGDEAVLRDEAAFQDEVMAESAAREVPTEAHRQPPMDVAATDRPEGAAPLSDAGPEPGVPLVPRILPADSRGNGRRSSLGRRILYAALLPGLFAVAFAMAGLVYTFQPLLRGAQLRTAQGAATAFAATVEAFLEGRELASEEVSAQVARALAASRSSFIEQGVGFVAVATGEGEPVASWALEGVVPETAAEEGFTGLQVASATIQSEAGPLGTVQVAASERAVNASMRSVLLLTLGAGLIPLVLGLLLVFVFTRRLKRRLTHLAGGIDWMAQGQLNHPIPFEGGDELSQLGRAMETLRLGLRARSEGSSRGPE